MYLKKSLLELVIQKVSLDKEIDDTGLIKMDSTLTNINYKEQFENARTNIIIIQKDIWLNVSMRFRINGNLCIMKLRKKDEDAHCITLIIK